MPPERPRTKPLRTAGRFLGHGLRAASGWRMLRPMQSGGSDPMARQMATLTGGQRRRRASRGGERAGSPRRRPSEFASSTMSFGARLIELKQALAGAPKQPSQEELELALSMMLKLAAQAAILRDAKV